MNKAQLVYSFYGKDNLRHVEPRDILCKDLILDEHSHQITTGQELHKHVQEGVVLKCGVQLDDLGVVRFGENVTLGADVS